MRHFFLFLAATLMAVTTVPGNTSDLINPESELTTTHTQSNKFMGALPQEKGPVEVTVSFELRDINNINDEDETVEFTGVLKTSWHDPRMVH
jgi:hypothetical protein